MLGRDSPLKGKPKSKEAIENQRDSLKKSYASGKTVHWGKGKNRSIETREKISNALKGSTNIGNVLQRERKHERMKLGAASYNCTILNIDDLSGITTAKCNTCDSSFKFTNQIFYPNRLVKIQKLCPACQPRDTLSSTGEREMFDFIKSIYGDTIIPNDRTTLGGYELDIYLPKLKIAFEFTGLYWHAEKQNPKRNHLLWKKQFAFKEGVRLITVYEDEWNNKRQIVESRIRGILGLHLDSFMARKMEIREVETSEARKFLLDNHLQGVDTSSIKIGLYSADELIQIATFKKSNMVKGGNGLSWELSRLCSKLNTRVQGGASKLIKNFQSNFNKGYPLISYADSRWSDGDLYSKLGFKYDGSSAPSYWYTKDYRIRNHRSKYMKHLLVKSEDDKLLTEWQLAQRLGLDRIWDCGTTKWTLG